jgi:hypothetical protein
MKKSSPLDNKPEKWLFYLLAITLVMFAIAFIGLWAFNSEEGFNKSDLLSGIAVGIIAQIIDGALGMAYGISATTFLLFNGMPPAVATGSVHISEIFTTGASGLSHWKMGNINKKLFRALIFPGIIGGVAGAFLITSIDGNIMRPWISAYLLIMGIYILIKAFKKSAFAKKMFSKRRISILAFIGGFTDSSGGGGWGPVITSTLLGSGGEARKTIGTVNSAEFFLSIATGLSFILLIGLSRWEIVAGLIIGGILAAPFAAYIVSKMPAKYLMILVGALVCGLSIINIYNSIFL